VAVMMGFVKVSREIYKLINQTIAQKGHHPFFNEFINKTIIFQKYFRKKSLSWIDRLFLFSM
jgi:hypothetical protein